jgi:hypothetical protein
MDNKEWTKKKDKKKRTKTNGQKRMDNKEWTIKKGQ